MLRGIELPAYNALCGSPYSRVIFVALPCFQVILGTFDRPFVVHLAEHNYIHVQYEYAQKGAVYPNRSISPEKVPTNLMTKSFSFPVK